MSLRKYQAEAVEAVRQHWANGSRAVLLVAPTGAGKTVMAAELLADNEPALFVAHRREIVLQTIERLRRRFGSRTVGAILAGEPVNARARIQVGTVQSLVARGERPDASKIVLDEAHHYVAPDWRVLVDIYGRALTVGPTATPQRGDGTPLGDIFDVLVPVASYSELIAAGYLVPALTLQPPMPLGDDLAQDPFDAWRKYSGGGRTFVACARVSIAHAVAKRFRDHGVIAAAIDGTTPKRERDRMLEAFRAGRLRVLVYVDTMTEGVDVPEAECLILAKNFGTVGVYIQTVGRVLRPAPGKTRAIVIDLTGCTIHLGLPAMDRAYSLEGKPISGMVGHGLGGGGDGPTFSQEVRGLELRAVNGEAPAPVIAAPIDETERRADYARWLGLARQHRMRDGFAAVKYREKYGEEPRREWA